MWKGLLGVLVAALLIAVFYWQQRSPATVVETVSVVRDSIESRLQLTGSVINDRTVTITALLDGEIMAIRAREGDQVERGTVLAELDSRQARALLDKASAELVLQRQTLDAAQRNHERIKRISAAGNASRQALDESLDAQLSAEASVKAAEATLTLNQLRLDNATVKSPFEGTVIEQSAETGQWLEAGTPLFTVVATEGTVIEAGVSASDWSQLALGQAVELQTESSSQDRWLSQVSWISPSVVDDPTSGRTVAVRIPLGDDAPPLLLGQEVDVDLTLQQVTDVLVVPLQALLEGESNQYSVFVLDEGTARRRVVEPGLSSLTHTEIREGLSEGERVILPGGKPLSDGQSVADTQR